MKEASNDFFEAVLNRPKPSTAVRALYTQPADPALANHCSKRLVADPAKDLPHQWDESFLGGLKDLTHGQGRDSLPPCMQGALDCMHQKSYSPGR